MPPHNFSSNGITQKLFSYASRINVRFILLVICVFSVVFVTFVFKEVATFTRMKAIGALSLQHINAREQEKRSDAAQVFITERPITSTQQESFKEKTTQVLNISLHEMEKLRREAKRRWAIEDPSSDVDVYARVLAMKDLFNEANQSVLETKDNERYPEFDAKILPSEIEKRLPTLNTTKLTPQDHTWQMVSGTSHEVFVYSAFYDRREPRCVRVIGMMESPSLSGVWCRLWFYNLSEVASSRTIHSVSVPAQVRLPLFICALEKELPVPTAVSIVGRLHVPPANLLLVRNKDVDLAARNISASGPHSPIADTPDATTEKTKTIAENVSSSPESNESFQSSHSRLNTNATKEQREHQHNTSTPLIGGGKSEPFIVHENKGTFVDPTATQTTNQSVAVCVKPLYETCDEVRRLLRFIEVNMLLGVHHYFLYNYTLGPRTECLVREYIANGIVTILPWQLNMTSPSKMRNNSLIASLNDCLYRTMYLFNFTAFVDMDEYVMPRTHYTLQELFTWLNTNTSKTILSQTGAYSFQEVEFNPWWVDDIRPHILLQEILEGKRKLPPQNRSRKSYICRPELTVIAGENFVSEFVRGFKTLDVPVYAAKLYNYEICDFFHEKNCTHTSSLVDNTAQRFGMLLQKGLRKRMPKIKSCWRKNYTNISSTEKFGELC